VYLTLLIYSSLSPLLVNIRPDNHMSDFGLINTSTFISDELILLLIGPIGRFDLLDFPCVEIDFLK